MKVAIFFVGEYRTFDRTWQVILDNIIRPNNADVFIHGSGFQTLNIFRERWGDCVKAVSQMDEDKQKEYLCLRDYLMKCKVALQPSVIARTHPGNLGYILRSGTLIEHYHNYHGFRLIREYELKMGIKYDIVIRSRLDNIVSFHLDLERFYYGIGSGKYLLSLGNKKVEEVIDPPQELLEKISGYDMPIKIPIIFAFRKNVMWIGRRV